MERSSIAEGERRTVTVLFVDMAGSTAIGERLDAEHVYALVKRGHARMQEAAYRHEGTVTQFRGDGVMALFGAPIAQEDAARRAVAAGLEMQRALRSLAGEIAERYGVTPAYRVGINTGPAVVGRIGDELAMEFTAIGDTVNLAARLESVAPAGEVVVSAATWRRVADFFEGESLEPLSLKGKAEAARAWRILRPTTLRTRFEAAAAHGLTPFVGRQHELALLEAVVEEARAGRGQVVVVSGEAGIGKTRLFAELHDRVSDEVRWVEGQCVSYGQQMPYLPVVDLVKGAHGVRETDDSEAIRGRVADPYLRWLLAVDPGDDRVVAMDPRERRGRLRDALRSLVRDLSSGGPLVVLVEDLHWIDDHSEEAVAAIADVVPELPSVLVLTHRPGYATALAERAGFQRIALASLAAPDTDELARGVLGVESVPPDVESLVRSKAEGNPLFVEEVTRSLVESGALRRVNGTVTRGDGAADVPDTLQEVILHRIDRLADEAKRSLQLASVIGREFTLRLLERVSDPQVQLDGALGELQALDLIYEKVWAPELAYMFKHALTHEVARSTLLVERRRRWHLVVARAIEELFAHRLAEEYETLAYHYFEGEDWAKALEYLVLAGNRAGEAFAAREAAASYRKAVDAWEHLGGEDLDVIGGLLEDNAFTCAFLLADFDAARADLARLRDLARRRSDPAWEARALAVDSMILSMLHELDAALANLRSADEVLRSAVDPDARPLVDVMYAFVYSVLGDVRRCRRSLRAAESSATETTEGWIAAQLLGTMAVHAYWSGRHDEAESLMARAAQVGVDGFGRRLMVLFGQRLFHALAEGTRGDYQAALRELEETVAFCERVGDWSTGMRCLNTVGWVYAELQAPERALPWNVRSLEEADALHLPDPEVQCNALLNMADNHLELGQLDEAEEALVRVEQVVRNPKPQDQLNLWRYSQHYFHTAGEVRLARGDLDGALSLAGECVELAERTDSPKNAAKGLRLRGQALAALGRIDDAERELLAASEAADRAGNPTQRWLTSAALGGLYDQTGRLDHARRAYADAAQVVRSVADGLSDEELREGFLSSPRVAEVLSRTT